MSRIACLLAACLLTACALPDGENSEGFAYAETDDEPGELTVNLGPRVLYGEVRDLSTGRAMSRVTVCAMYSVTECTTTSRDGRWALDGKREALAGSKDGESIILEFSRAGFYPVRATRAKDGWVTEVDVLMLPDTIETQNADPVDDGPQHIDFPWT